MPNRSLLFAPANRLDLIAKVGRSRPDLCVIDLEDGTPQPERPGARATLAQAVNAVRGQGQPRVFVRVNPRSHPDFEDDRRAVAAAEPDGVVLAKAEYAEDAAAFQTLPVIAGVESLRGVANARSIAAAPGVVGLYFGSEDFSAEMRGRRTPGGQEVLFARSEVVFAARLAQIVAYDQAVINIRDDEQFLQDAALGRSLGYDGKMCLLPRQVDLAHQIFGPTEAEVEHARRLIAAYDEGRRAGRGTIDFQGQMIDAPVLKAAQQLLAADAEIARGASEG